MCEHSHFIYHSYTVHHGLKLLILISFVHFHHVPCNRWIDIRIAILLYSFISVPIQAYIFNTANTYSAIRHNVVQRIEFSVMSVLLKVYVQMKIFLFDYHMLNFNFAHHSETHF